MSVERDPALALPVVLRGSSIVRRYPGMRAFRADGRTASRSVSSPVRCSLPINRVRELSELSGIQHRSATHPMDLVILPVAFRDAPQTAPELHSLASGLPWTRLFAAWGSSHEPLGTALLARSVDGYRVKIVAECTDISRALLSHVALLVGRLGARKVSAWDPVPAGSAALEACLAAGFLPGPVTTRFRLETAAIHAVLTPVVERLRARRRIPAEGRVISLGEAVTEGRLSDVIALERAEVASPAISSFDSVSQEHGLDRALSRVALVGDTVVALVLGRVTEAGVFFVATRAVAPSLRNGWAGALLMQQGTAGLLTAHVYTIVLTATDGNSDTMMLARKGKGRIERESNLPYVPTAFG